MGWADSQQMQSDALSAVRPGGQSARRGAAAVGAGFFPSGFAMQGLDDDGLARGPILFSISSTAFFLSVNLAFCSDVPRLLLLVHSAWPVGVYKKSGRAWGLEAVGLVFADFS